MAYFYNSTYPEVLDNYQYYQHQYNNFDSINHDSRYVQYYDAQFNANAYQHAPNPSLVGYYYSNYYQPEGLLSKNAYFHENGDYYYYSEPVSTEYIVSYNTTSGEAHANTDVSFEEYNPKPFHGGYNINETYGKPLPPSEEICYPPSTDKTDPNAPSLDASSYGSVPSPYVIKDDKKVENEDEPKQTNGVTPNKVIQDEDEEEEEDDDEDDGDDYDDDDDADDDVGDGGGGGDGDEKGEKQDDLGKEPVMVAPVASVGDAVDEKKDQNVEGEKKDDFDRKSSKGTKQVTFADELHEKDHNQNVEGEKKDDFDKKSSEGTKKVSFDDELHGKDHNRSVGEVIQGEKPSKFESKEEEEEEEDHFNGERKKDDNGSQIKRQIPPGYGMETLDLCEGIFGGYFPCLWKKYQRNHNQESGSYEKMSDYDYCCKDTVDYLFGNPNPYGGTMPEKGSYGDPVYSYQRYYPQQSLTEQVDCYGGHSSWLQSSSYYYGHNGDYQR